LAADTLELLEPTPLSIPAELPDVGDIVSQSAAQVSRAEPMLSTPVSTSLSVPHPGSTEVEPAAFEALEDIGRQDWQPEQVTDIVDTDRPLPPDTEFEPKDLPGFSSAAVVSRIEEPIDLIDMEPATGAMSTHDIEQNELIALADTFAEEELKRESKPSISKPVSPEMSSEAFVQELFGESRLSEQDRYVDTIREETELHEQQLDRQSAFASKTATRPAISQAVSSEIFKREPEPEPSKPVPEGDTLSLAAKKMSEAVLSKEQVGTESSFFLLDDEVDTKLDLARAYIEMGDKAGAVDLLKEVEEEGDSRQKREAGDLLVLTR
jgi:pilus assembly protein FimV